MVGGFDWRKFQIRVSTLRTQKVASNHSVSAPQVLKRKNEKHDGNTKVVPTSNMSEN